VIEICTEEVLSRFSMLCGMEDAGAYQSLCADAAAEIAAGECASCGEESRDALTAAAAALAFYRYVLSYAGTGAESFSAGDVKVAAGAGNPESARKLWERAASAAAPYLTDTGCFLFGRIRP
jgi:hypothetical protein